MRLFSGKKGALELSINTIVIIVLAMTLLGLGLTFIRSQFKQISETTGTVQQQVKEQILEDLRTGDKKLSFPSTDVQLEKGNTETFALGVKNTQGTGDLTFTIELTVEGTRSEGDGAGTEAISFFYDQGPFTLGAAESEVYPFQITDVAKNSETYRIKIKIIDSADPVVPYAEKTFFLTVG